VEQHTPDRLTGSIIYIDHFGNCISNITPDQQDISPISAWHVELDDATVVPLRKYYGQVAEHEPVALIGSSGYLEIAVRNGSAAESLGIIRGTRFTLKRGL
jgi:S-adenosylmethionine hydrolase